MDTLKQQIQKLLADQITLFALKEQDTYNNVYYTQTLNGGTYIVKQERDTKEFQPHNDLVVEAAIAQQLYDLDLSIPTPHVVFVSKTPKLYGYEYFEGDMLQETWDTLTEYEKIEICRALGAFHAEIGKKVTKKMTQTTNTKIDLSPDLSPKVLTEYNNLIASTDVPEKLKTLAKDAIAIFNGTIDQVVFQFIHNNSHHENIIINNKKISGIIDFSNSKYGEIAKEFFRYIRDYPNHFQHIVAAYEQASGNKLSYTRLVSNALLSDLADIMENYRKGGEPRLTAQESIEKYQTLINSSEMKKTKPAILVQFTANLFAGSIVAFIGIWLQMIAFGLAPPLYSFALNFIAIIIAMLTSEAISRTNKPKLYLINIYLFLTLPIIFCLITSFEDSIVAVIISLIAILYTIFPAIVVTSIFNWRQ